MKSLPGEKLPGRVNKVLDILSNNELRLNVDAIDEALLIDGLHKIANRIALGLILAGRAEARARVHTGAGAARSVAVVATAPPA